MKIELKQYEYEWLVYSECEGLNGVFLNGRYMYDVLTQTDWSIEARYLKPIILREWLKQGRQLDVKWLQRRTK